MLSDLQLSHLMQGQQYPAGPQYPQVHALPWCQVCLHSSLRQPRCSLPSVAVGFC